MDEFVYTFIYRLLLHGKPVEELNASTWRMHVVTDREERAAIVDHYNHMFDKDPNKTWEIVLLELPA